MDFNRWTFETTPDFSLKNTSTTARVLDVYDGDTITLAMPLFGTVFKVHVRLNGIDTPEIKSQSFLLHKTAVRSRNRVLQMVGLNGITDVDKEYTRQEVRDMLNTTVCLVTINAGDFDKYGRLLGDVIVQGRLVSSVLKGEGYAYVYEGKTKKSEAQQEEEFHGLMC